MDVLALDAQLNEMIIQGHSVDALHQLYSDDVVAQENDDPERAGRAAWIAGREATEKMIKKFGARVLAHAAQGDVSFSEWEYDVDIEGMGPLKIVQVAVRRWKDGKVVRERFYHK
jgi:ketosteroid isomerase-like protein